MNIMGQPGQMDLCRTFFRDSSMRKKIRAFEVHVCIGATVRGNLSPASSPSRHSSQAHQRPMPLPALAPLLQQFSRSTVDVVCPHHPHTIISCMAIPDHEASKSAFSAGDLAGETGCAWGLGVYLPPTRMSAINREISVEIYSPAHPSLHCAYLISTKPIPPSACTLFGD